MGQSNCKLNAKQRSKALKALGFEKARSGNGSHEIWENAKLKELAQGRNLQPPENLRSGVYAQSVWAVTVPHDPAGGTWNSIIKYAEWCQKMVKELGNSPVSPSRQSFNNAAPRPPGEKISRRRGTAKDVITFRVPAITDL